MLYHIDLGMPRRVKAKFPSGLKRLKYSNHAYKEVLKDRDKLRFYVPDVVCMERATLIEADEISKDRGLAKIVFRYPLYDIDTQEEMDYHIVFAAIPEKGGLFIKTAWVNHKDDNHRTLNPNRFASMK